jgi:hypothetical protein
MTDTVTSEVGETQTTPIGSLSTTAGVLPGTTLNADQMASITNMNIKNAVNPEVAPEAKATATLQEAKPEEMLTTPEVTPEGVQADKAQVDTLQASTVGNVAQAAQQTPFAAAGYTAVTVDPAELAGVTHAVTSALPDNALVSTQLQKLLTPDENGNLPSWVQPAVTAANQLLAGRGISNTTMAGQAITAAILTSAMPVATANATAEYNAWSQNLNNEQSAAMQNGALMAQAILSNQGAENAAANFNATSENQTNQFLASMATQINTFNATQMNAISQFNASQTQTASTARVQLYTQLEEFNATMRNEREKFNVANAMIVQQSNAEYLRQVNTANTAVQNETNQMNAQNAYNLSTQALANLQTQFNDEATMLYNANMTAEEQNFAMTYLAQQYGLQAELDKAIIAMESNANFNSQLGTMVGNLFSSGTVSQVANAIFGGGVTGSTTGGVSGNAADNISGASGGTDNISGGTTGGSTWLGEGYDYVSSGVSDAWDWASGGVSEAADYLWNLF